MQAIVVTLDRGVVALAAVTGNKTAVMVIDNVSLLVAMLMTTRHGMDEYAISAIMKLTCMVPKGSNATALVNELRLFPHTSLAQCTYSLPAKQK